VNDPEISPAPLLLEVRDMHIDLKIWIPPRHFFDEERVRADVAGWLLNSNRRELDSREFPAEVAKFFYAARILPCSIPQIGFVRY